VLMARLSVSYFDSESRSRDGDQGSMQRGGETEEKDGDGEGDQNIDMKVSPLSRQCEELR
jgi:hypothetical protein